MPHHVYTTKGVVLGLRPVRETDMLATVLTRDLGLVLAGARGMRKPGSKVTPALLELALVRVSLIRGKNSWRVTTVTLIRDSAREMRDRRASLAALARVGALIQRLLRGEEKHPELFDEFENSILKLLDNHDANAEDWEVYAVSRILLHAGYLKTEDVANDLSDAHERKREIVKAINFGMRESGLA